MAKMIGSGSGGQWWDDKAPKKTDPAPPQPTNGGGQPWWKPQGVSEEQQNEIQGQLNDFVTNLINQVAGPNRTKQQFRLDQYGNSADLRVVYPNYQTLIGGKPNTYFGGGQNVQGPALKSPGVSQVQPANPYALSARMGTPVSYPSQSGPDNWWGNYQQRVADLFATPMSEPTRTVMPDTFAGQVLQSSKIDATNRPAGWTYRGMPDNLGNVAARMAAAPPKTPAPSTGGSSKPRYYGWSGYGGGGGYSYSPSTPAWYVSLLNWRI